MNKEHIEKIREACVRANPGIKALPEYPYNPDAAKAVVELEKIASKTLWNETLEHTASMMVENYQRQKAADYVAMLRNEYPGRPIRLADVLLAINSGPKWPETWFITTAGYFFNVEMVSGGDKNPKWNLRDDNLEHQSEDTLAFIAALL